ncbi:MAG: hypothetical protein Kow0069_29140 [Promethearchaeota archaeon]
MGYDVDQIRAAALASNLARLFQILTDMFGLERGMKPLGKLEGKVVVAEFPKAGGGRAFLSAAGGRVVPFEGDPEHSDATLMFNLDAQEVVPAICEVIRMPNNFRSLVKLAFKYLLRGKVKDDGSWGVALKFLRALMIGEHQMYRDEREGRRRR